MTKRFARLVLIFAIALVTLPMYQNCSPLKFNSTSATAAQQTSASSTVTTSGTLAPPAVTGATTTVSSADPAAQAVSTTLSMSSLAANQCFDISCTAVDWTVKTLTGASSAQGTVAVLAPNGLSSWVVQIDSNLQLATYLNCLPDQSTQKADFTSSSLCSFAAPTTANLYTAGSAMTFANGAGQFLRSCEVAPCGVNRTLSTTRTDDVYEWFSASVNESTSSAVLQIRTVAPSGVYSPGRFNIDLTVPVGQCVQDTVALVAVADGSVRDFSYEACLSGKTLTIQDGFSSLPLDLSGLTPSAAGSSSAVVSH